MILIWDTGERSRGAQGAGGKMSECFPYNHLEQKDFLFPEKET